MTVELNGFEDVLDKTWELTIRKDARNEVRVDIWFDDGKIHFALDRQVFEPDNTNPQVVTIAPGW